MSYGFMDYAGVIFTLPVLISQWVGILGLGKARRNGAWWCMMSGVCGTTLGTLSYGVLILMLAKFSLSSSPTLMYYYFIPTGLSGLGSLLFAIGFAIHGQQASKTDQRITELETIAKAQGEELNRLRAS